ncbi:MAG: hypothetical protein GC151_10990 [Betaproteobacteria bacterium]|nr:hypothetical protein [Betaproteobacteria bacterium]
MTRRAETRQGLVVYGATGHTGALIASFAAARWQAARRRGAEPLWAEPPLLAGRDATRLRSLADPLGLPWVAASLDDAASLDAALAQRAIVIHAAGPFAGTAVRMVRACLRTRTHYLDVSGEFASFRQVDDFNVDATQLGVMLMPGAGFVVTASDYLAARLAREVPGLHTLRIAMSSAGELSRGSLATLLEASRMRVTIRRAGRYVAIPPGQREREFCFADSDFGPATLCSAVQLPDLLSAVETTRGLSSGDASEGVANVETYAEADVWRRVWLQGAAATAALTQAAPVKRFLQRRIAQLPEVVRTSPPRAQIVVAEGEDRYGALCRRARLETDDVYAFSAWSAVLLAEFAARRGAAARTGLAGIRTPAGLFHDELHASLAECDHVRVSPIRSEGLGARHGSR